MSCKSENISSVSSSDPIIEGLHKYFDYGIGRMCMVRERGKRYEHKILVEGTEGEGRLKKLHVDYDFVVRKRRK
jgi:hypothetical protein